MELIDKVYTQFGFKYKIELSTCPDDFIGSEEMRKFSEDTLRRVLEKRGVAYELNPGDGAFYGPKIDFHLQDCLGRTWQCGTIQLDFQMPERFDLSYIGPDGEKHRPIMIHRVVYGSIERFIGVLTEHTAGAFPVWLAPVQAIVMPITDRARAYAQSVQNTLEAGRACVRRATTATKRSAIRSVRRRCRRFPTCWCWAIRKWNQGTYLSASGEGGEQSVMPLEAFVEKIKNEIDNRVM